MRKIFTKVVGFILSVSFVLTVSMINSNAITSETEKLTQEMKSLSIRAKENEEKAKKELEEALENYLASIKLLRINNEMSVSEKLYQLKECELPEKYQSNHTNCRSHRGLPYELLDIYDEIPNELSRRTVYDIIEIKCEDLIKLSIDKLHKEAMSIFNPND